MDCIVGLPRFITFAPITSCSKWNKCNFQLKWHAAVSNNWFGQIFLQPHLCKKMKHLQTILILPFSRSSGFPLLILAKESLTSLSIWSIPWTFPLSPSWSFKGFRPLVFQLRQYRSAVSGLSMRFWLLFSSSRRPYCLLLVRSQVSLLRLKPFTIWTCLGSLC